MEIPDDRVRRFAVRYKSQVKLAHAMAPNAGRQARQIHAEAMALGEAAMALLGPDVWHEMLDAT